MYKSEDVNQYAFRAVLVGKALLSHIAVEFNKNMIFNVSSCDISKDFKDRITWKEPFVIFFVCFPFFTHGIVTTILSVNTLGDDLWNETGMIVGAAVSGPIFCYIIDKCGRKIGIFIISLMQAATCIPLFLDLSVTNMLLVYILTGVSSGGLFTVLPIYIREISPMSIRGVALSTMMLMISAGYLMKLAMNVEEMMLMMVAFVMMQILTMMIIVESPSYLIMAGKCEAAAVAVAKLKSLPNESPGVLQEINNLKNEGERARANGRLTLYQIFKNRIWLDITKIGIVLYTVNILCGSITFLDQDKALQQLKLPGDPDSKLVIISWCVGTVFCFLMIKFMERRNLLTFGYAVMVVSMGILGVYTQTELTVQSLTWLPIVMLPIVVFGYGITWGLPTVIMVEMYTFEIRATLLGMLYTYSELIKLAHVHSIKYIEDYMGTYTLFYIFTGINIFAAVYILFRVPDIKDRTVRQIEKQVKRVPILK